MGSLIGKKFSTGLAGGIGGVGSYGMNQQQGGGINNPHPGGDILLEDGSFLLQEDGTSTFLLEQQ